MAVSAKSSKDGKDSIESLIEAGRVFGQRADRGTIESRLKRDKISKPLIPVWQRHLGRNGKHYVSPTWAIVTGVNEVGETTYRTFRTGRSGRVQESWVCLTEGSNFQLDTTHAG